MSTSGPLRLPRIVEVPPGPQALDALWEPLDSALRGEQAIAPIPTASSGTPSAIVDAIRRAVHADEPVHTDTALVVTTSGSTGNPRGVEISARAADYLSRQVNARAGGAPAWVLAIPATSIGGINVLIRARASGNRPVIAASLGGAQRFTDEVFAEAVTTAASSNRPVAVSLVPAQLPRLLSSETGRAALRDCSLVLVGGSALAPQAARDCTDAGITITTTYGMTETSGGCVLDGEPLDGVQVRVGDLDSTDDRIWLQGPMLATRYRDAGPSPFVDDWLRTNDRGRWSGGRLQVLGRLDDIVTVNGVNVDLMAIEDRVRDYPGVRDAIVLALPDDESDHVLHLAYVADDLADDDIPTDALEAWIAEQLGGVAAPRNATRVESFTMTSTGKIDRIATGRSLGILEDPANPGGDVW